MDYVDDKGTVRPGSVWMNVGVNHPRAMSDGETFKIYLKKV
jgi:hypothetical protein